MDSQDRLHLQEDIYTLIDEFDVAGLGKTPPRNHLLSRARGRSLRLGPTKVGATCAEIDRLLERAGFVSAS